MSSEEGKSVVGRVANELVDVRATIKDLQAREKELAGALKSAFSGKVSGMIDGVFVEMTPVAGRTTYDTKAMIDDGMDLTAYKKVGQPSVRLSVKRVEEIA